MFLNKEQLRKDLLKFFKKSFYYPNTLSFQQEYRFIYSKILHQILPRSSLIATVVRVASESPTAPSTPAPPNFRVGDVLHSWRHLKSSTKEFCRTSGSLSEHVACTSLVDFVNRECSSRLALILTVTAALEAQNTARQK